MAWAEKLDSGRYRGVYRDDGGSKRSAGIFTHKAKAARAAAAKEDKARRSMRADPEAYRRTWGEWCDEEWWPSRTVEASTMRHDLARVRNHLRPRWGDVPLGAITRQDVRAWAVELRRKPLAPMSVQRCVYLLSASLVAAMDAEVLDANPVARLKLPGGPPAVERFLTENEYDAIHEQLPTTGDQLVADLLVNTGLRWGELAGLHWSRVDLGRGLLRVVETYDETAGIIKAYPKSRKARIVPLTPELVETLTAAVEARGTAATTDSCGVDHAAGRCPGPLLLTSDEGTPLRNSNWNYRVWKPAVRHAAVGHVRIHDLRHTYASWLLQQGVDIAVVSALLGHASIATTERYAHLAGTPNEAVLAALRSARSTSDRGARSGAAAPDLPHAGGEDTVVQA